MDTPVSVYPGISRILFFVRGHQGGGALRFACDRARRGPSDASRRSSRKPGFVVRGGRSRDTRPRTADLGSGDRGHGPMLSPDPCKSLAPPRVASREIPVDPGKSRDLFFDRGQRAQRVDTGSRTRRVGVVDFSGRGGSLGAGNRLASQVRWSGFETATLDRPLSVVGSAVNRIPGWIPAIPAGDVARLFTDGNTLALVHNSRSRSIIALHPEIRGPA